VLTQDLLKNLNETPMKPHYTLASLDITNMYSNIPYWDEENLIQNSDTKLNNPQNKKRATKMV
jgi:hypothetical protein